MWEKSRLRHTSIKTTMDRYAHVTDESLAKAVQQFEADTPQLKRGCNKNIEKGENPHKSRVFRQVKINMKLGIVIICLISCMSV